MKTTPLFKSELWKSFKQHILSKYICKDENAKRYLLSIIAETHGSMHWEYTIAYCANDTDAKRYGELFSMFMYPPSEGFISWSAGVENCTEC